MISLIYTDEDIASFNIAKAMCNKIDFKEGDNYKNDERFKKKEIIGFYRYENLNLIGINSRLVYSEFLDTMNLDNIIFLSRHSSVKGVKSFTVHALGNWNDKHDLGGEPKQLGISNPESMIKILKEFSILQKNAVEFKVTYEATHHGPLLKTPALFAEFGGDEGILNNPNYADIVANAIKNSFEKEPEYDKIAIGIGGPHYSTKFTKLALDGKYAFSHIMSRYYVNEIDMLEQAVEKSKLKAEIAVIEKKSMNSPERSAIINKLNDLGIDNTMV